MRLSSAALCVAAASTSSVFLLGPDVVHGFAASSSASSHTRSSTQSIAFVSTRSRSSTLTVRPAIAESSSDSSSSVVERLPDSAVCIDIQVPAAATKAAYDKVCTELSKQVTIPGFRKGSKIPPQVLEASMSAKGGRNALKVQAINELVSQLVEPTLKEQALDPIGQPTLVTPAEDLAEDFTAGEALSIKVKCDVWPEIKWIGNDNSEKAYTGLTGTYQRKPFNQEKLDLAMRDLMERYATLEPIDASTASEYALQMGDACTVNMVGYMAQVDGVSKGDPLPNAASGDKVEVILGTGRYMEGLVEGLVGAKQGETVTVGVNFPEKLRDKALAGKKAIFDVEVLEASKRHVPAMSDEFAAKVKSGLTEESLVAELKKAIDEEDSKEFVPARNKVIGDGLAQVMSVDVPDTLITNQAREKFAMMMSEMRDGGVSDDEIKKQISPENFLKYKDIVKDDIVRDFKISMATDEIARLEGIDVPDYQVEEQMEAIRKDADGAEDFDENMIRAKVQTTLQRQAVMDWLAEQSDLKVEYGEEDDSFDEELMQKLADEAVEREKAMAVQSGAPVVDAVVESEAAPANTASQPKSTAAAAAAATPADAEVDTSNMTLEEKAFQAVLNSGAIQINKGPGDPDYDPSADDEEADGTVYKSKILND